MEEKILPLLKAKFSGEREDGLGILAGAIALQADTEENATKAVEALTPDKVKSFIVNWRKTADSELTKANKTHEETLKKKFDFVEKKNPNPNPNPDPNPNPSNNIDEIVAAALKKHFEPLQQKLELLENGKTAELRLNKLNEVLKEANPLFKTQTLKSFSKINFDTEEDFTAYIDEVRADSTQFTQELVNQGLLNNGKTFFPNQNNNKTATVEECDKIVEIF